MRIGIDAKWFYDGPPSGKVVIQNLVKNLIKENEKNELFIFLDAKAKNEPFPIEGDKLHLSYIWNGINSISNVFILKRKAISLKLDVVLFQNFSAISSKFHSIAYIHDILFLSHPQFFGIMERIYFFPMKYLARKSKLIITISNSEKKRLVEHKFSDKDSIKVVYHGVDKKFYPQSKMNPNLLKQIKKKYNLPEQFLLYVGRLNVRKNIKNLLLALKNIENKRIPLVIVGKKDHKMFDINSFILENKLTDRVQFLGFVPDKNLPVIYAMASIFCFPSYAEGFGLPILEAMAAKVPVLTSNTTSMPEISGNASILVSPDNVHEITNGINHVLSDKEYASQMIEKGFLHSKKFTWKKNARLILEHIENI